ncbi:MAG: FAD-dependent oxidoreductase [Halobacteriovoraceae bacterium]|nr:FAD-dependent oxidoreductase [Halobacteriovoraceae bacterium]
MSESDQIEKKRVQTHFFPNTLGLNEVDRKIIFISKEKEIIELLKENGNASYYPISTGHNWGYGCLTPTQDNAIILNLSQMNQISDFDDELGTLRVGPGVTYQQLADFLKNNGDRWLCPIHGGGPECSVLGNSIERGFGITPYTDHFHSVQSLRAILPNGKIYESPLRKMGFPKLADTFRWGVGPYLDGIFTQSNFGVVTEISLALAAKAEHTEMFFIHIKNNISIHEIINVVKIIFHKFEGNIGGINIMNDYRIYSMMADKLSGDVIENSRPIDRKILDKAKKLFGITDWTIVGAVYSSKNCARVISKEIKKNFRPIAKRTFFIHRKKLKIIKTIADLGIKFGFTHLKEIYHKLEAGMQFTEGTPNKNALRLAYLRNLKHFENDEDLDPTKDNCGIIWYSPLIELKGNRAQEYVEMVERVAKKCQSDPLITLSALNPRHIDSTIPILFNKENHSDVKKAHHFYNCLITEGAKQEFFPYRFGLNSFKYFFERIEDNQLAKEIKKAIDPDNRLSPGRYLK